MEGRQDFELNQILQQEIRDDLLMPGIQHMVDSGMGFALLTPMVRALALLMPPQPPPEQMMSFRGRLRSVRHESEDQSKSPKRASKTPPRVQWIGAGVGTAAGQAGICLQLEKNPDPMGVWRILADRAIRGLVDYGDVFPMPPVGMALSRLIEDAPEFREFVEFFVAKRASTSSSKLTKVPQPFPPGAGPRLGARD